MRAIFVLSDKRDVVGYWTSRTNTNYYSHMKNRKMLSILGMMFILCSVISCKGDDKPGTGVNPADRDIAPGEPISIVDGKVRFYIDIDTDAARVKAGVAAADLLSAASSVYVNGTKYDVASDESGNLYVDALANAQGTYTASLAFEDGTKWFGTSPTINLAVPASQFASDGAMKLLPMFADYNEATGNKLFMKDAVGILSLHIGGSAKIASVKLQKKGSDMAGLFLKTKEGLEPSDTTANFVTLNCTNRGEFVSAGSDFNMMLRPGNYSGAELVICTDDNRVMRTSLDVDVKANGFEAKNIDFKADDNVLWYDGFDLCTWGGNIMGGSQAAGMSPSSAAVTSTGAASGADRLGTDYALSAVAYNVPGCGFIQNNWNNASGKTVGDAHDMSDSYVISRNLTGYTYLFRSQEFQGVMGVSYGTTARGIIATPRFTAINGFRNVKIVVRFCPNAGFDDLLLFSVIDGGMITSASLDGKALPEDLIEYMANSANTRLLNDRLSIPASMATPQEWHTLELNVKNATNSTYLWFAGESVTTGNYCFFVDSIEVTDLGESFKKSGLRVLYWNIQDGMWADQPNQYKNFIEWVKAYDPDVCVWCEAASIYKDYSTVSAPEAERYLPNGWPDIAKKYGHEYSALGGHRDNFPQEITSKYPITTLLKITDTDQAGKPVSHGAAIQQLDVKGRKINIVTLHMWPQLYAYGVPKAGQDASKANNEGDKYREFEMKYIVDHTVNAPEYASHTDWLMMGDFNSRSMVDEWYYKYADTKPTYYLCQNVIKDNTSLVDIIGNFYPGCFVSSTGGKARIDYMYASASLYSKVKNAITIIDTYTVPVKDAKYNSGFYFPSDHRPILVDFEL